MTDDLVQRLRAAFKTNRPLQAEAADEIERLQAENATLRAVGNVLDAVLARRHQPTGALGETP